MAPECKRFNKRLAEPITAKSDEAYSHVMRHVRNHLQFALLRATLIAIRGSRGRRRSDVELDIEDILFNLLPVPRDENYTMVYMYVFLITFHAKCFMNS